MVQKNTPILHVYSIFSKIYSSKRHNTMFISLCYTAVHAYVMLTYIHDCTLVHVMLWYPFTTSNLCFLLQAEYAELRPLSYPQTDCFLLCFSLRSRPSFINVRLKWLKEIKQYKEDAPVILVGCKNGKKGQSRN